MPPMEPRTPEENKRIRQSANALLRMRPWLKEHGRRRVANLRDPVTGLAGRAKIVLALHNHLQLEKGLGARMRGERPAFSIAVFDAKNLKKVNDYEGRDVGNAGLRIIADAMKKRGTSARLEGGDELLLFLPHGDDGEVKRSLEAVVSDVGAKVAENPALSRLGFGVHWSYVIFTPRERLGEGFVPMKLLERSVRAGMRNRPRAEVQREYVSRVLAIAENAFKAAKGGSRDELDRELGRLLAAHGPLTTETLETARHLNLVVFRNAYLEELRRMRRP